jgi:hypothetical protein
MCKQQYVLSTGPFIKNNTSELPDLPHDSTMSEDGFPMPEGFSTKEEINLMCSESEMRGTSLDSEIV